jgi:outer membrane protein assembly factor BamB
MYQFCKSPATRFSGGIGMASTTPESNSARDPKARSVWPALLLVVLGVACSLSINLMALDPENMPLMALFMTYMWGPPLCALLLLGWWLLRGPAPLGARLVVTGAAAAIAVGSWFAVDPSMHSYLWMQGLPGAVGAAALALLVPARLSGVRVAAALLLGVAALLPWGLWRLNGMTGSYAKDVAFRWQPTAEQAALAYTTKSGPSLGESSTEVPAAAGLADWPGFRGPHRDGVVAAGTGDWSAPPREAWRHPVGPAWSSVCVVGDRLFTQEQAGPEELVTCYLVADGRPLWRHAEAARHADNESGPGPRATPTFHDRKIYALGAEGLLTCLNAGDGTRVWGADLRTATEKGDKVPGWGMAGSPLVVGDKVIVHPGVKDGPRLLAFDAKTGAPAWTAPGGANTYSSPQLAELAGVPQVLIVTSAGLFSHDPETGQELWKSPCAVEDFSPTCTQPLLLPGDKLVIGGSRIGMPSRCLQVAHGADGWTVTEVWKAKFSPSFNDFVHRDGFLYGLDSGRLVCLDAATGKQRWKDGNFGAGQLLLVGDKLLVQAEAGEVHLVAATPEGFREVATHEALTDKTWNHPVVANGRLFVRNGREVVCFDLGGATSPP